MAVLVTCVVTHGLRAWDLKKPGNTSGAAINAPKLIPVFSSPTGGHLENLKSYQECRSRDLEIPKVIPKGSLYAG